VSRRVYVLVPPSESKAAGGRREPGRDFFGATLAEERRQLREAVRDFEATASDLDAERLFRVRGSLLAQARAVPIPFYGELGSVNPLVVTAAAARERARAIGEGLTASVTLGSGQFCTKPGLIFVPRGEGGDELVAAAVAALEAGAGATMLSLAIRDRFESGLDELDALAGLECLGRSGRAATAAGSFAALYATDLDSLGRGHEALEREYFGAVAIIVRYAGTDELHAALAGLEPALIFSLHVADDDPDGPALLAAGRARAGRVLVNGFPTGVGVSWSMHHGGPHPAATSSLHSSVGASAMRRWLRPVCYQNVPPTWLPESLRDDNPLGILQRVDGHLVGPSH
jgi:NADP-dependent aldehyde dehydrogenase